MSKRPFPMAVAQLGPIHLADSREAVVRRLQGLFPEVKGLLVDLVNATQRKWGRVR